MQSSASTGACQWRLHPLSWPTPVSQVCGGSALSCILRLASFWFGKWQFCGAHASVPVSEGVFCLVPSLQCRHVQVCLRSHAILLPRLWLWRRQVCVLLLSICCPRAAEASLQSTSASRRLLHAPLGGGFHTKPTESLSFAASCPDNTLINKISLVQVLRHNPR